MEVSNPVKKYMSSLGKKSWEVQKKKKTSEFFREMQRKSVRSRNKNKKRAVDNLVV